MPPTTAAPRTTHIYEIIVVLIATLIFGLAATSPPSLMDDVDAVQAQIARTMLESGDWVTAGLDCVAYLKKAARFPLVLCTIALCWLTVRIGAWAFSPRRLPRRLSLVLAGVVVPVNSTQCR